MIKINKALWSRTKQISETLTVQRLKPEWLTYPHRYEWWETAKTKHKPPEKQPEEALK
jgi:hypothetical protein